MYESVSGVDGPGAEGISVQSDWDIIFIVPYGLSNYLGACTSW